MPLRFVTAASLFDGHDASINIMRRLLQRHGAEVVHLGHNRSVDEVVAAVVEEDPHGVAVSSYQGGHVEYFGYLVDRLRDEGYGHVKVYGGGGGVIVPSEIEALHAYGVARLFSPEDGHRLGPDDAGWMKVGKRRRARGTLRRDDVGDDRGRRDSGIGAGDGQLLAEVFWIEQGASLA